jgi:hypothetical protein
MIWIEWLITYGWLAKYEFLTQNFNMKTIQEIAQWVIDNRYPKSENDKVSDFEMYHTLIEAMNQILRQPPVTKSVCTCMAFHKSDECYKLGCKAHRSDNEQTVS